MAGRRVLLWASLGLALATAVAYSPVVGNGFVNYDDNLYLQQNDVVGAGLTPGNLAWAFTSFEMANWHPLTWISWMTEVELFGLDARVLLITNVALHVLGSVLLLLFFARATGAPLASAFVAAVFALHPLHVESVAWVSSRKDVLSGVFFALTLLAYERRARPGLESGARRRRGAAVFGLLALGLMSKPTLVVTPFVLLLLDVWPFERWRAVGARRCVIEKLPLFALVAVSSAITYAAQAERGAVQSLERIPFDARVYNALLAYVRYLGDAFWPAGLAPFYPYERELLTPAVAAVSVALLALVTAVALRRRPTAVGWLWFLGTLVPVLGLVQVGQAARADRYTYLPLVGLSVAVAWGFSGLAGERRSVRAALWMLSVSALCACGVATNLQVRHWHDSFTLFEHALAVTKDNHVAHINLGVANSNEGRLELAEQHVREGIRLAPTSWTAYAALGLVLVRQGRSREAVRPYRVALEHASPRERRWDWFAGLGQAYDDLGRTDEAIANYRAALRLDPKRATVHRNLARALLAQKQITAAIASAEEAIRLDPELAEAHAYLGLARLEAGETARGIADLERSLALSPDQPVMHMHLARALEGRGDARAALEHFAEAARLEPGDVDYQTLWAHALIRAGEDRAACERLRAAIALGDETGARRNDLAWLLATSDEAGVRDAAEALRLAREAADATGRRYPAVLDTLAAAQAAGGDHAAAAATLEEALALPGAEAQGRLGGELRERLADYRARARAGAPR